MMRGARWSVVSLFAAALTVAGCGGGGATSGTGAGGGQGAIKIGASLPLTGQFSEPGNAEKRGYEVWQDLTNRSGGLMGRPVKVIIRDDASNQNAIISDYNALISRDKVDLLIGTFSSLLNFPSATVAERNRMLFIEPAGDARPGYRYVFFAQEAPTVRQGLSFVKLISGLPASRRPKTAAYPEQDDPFAAPVVEVIRRALEKLGIRTVYKTVYPPDTSNFLPIANAIKGAGAQLVVQGSIFTDAVGLARSFQQINYRPRMLFQTTAPSLGDQYAKAVGPANTEGTFYAVSYSPRNDYPQNKQFLATYRRMFGGAPAEDAADAFAAAQVLAAAVKGTGQLNDQKRLADWLRANTVRTILAPLSWNSYGAPQGAYLLAQWQNGTAQIVLPKEIATTSKVVYRRPGST